VPESLSDKLKSLGVQVGARNLAAPARKKRNIEALIPGEVVNTPFGPTYVVENWYGSQYEHGSIRFDPALNMRMLTECCRVPHLSISGIGRLLFLDTETTGLGGGTGTFAFLVGIGHLTPDGFHLIQLLMRSPEEERAMLYLLNQYLGQFDALVTYNGKSFDVPLLKTRHVLNAFTHPFDDYGHIDLLPVARRVWRNRLPSRSLGSLEVDIVGVSRTQDEVPGYMIPEIYFDYLRSGDASQLSGVLYHNAMDILSLAALFQYTARLLDDPLGSSVPQGLDVVAIARLYEELGLYSPAIQLYEAGLSLGMPEPFFIQTLVRFAALYRKQGDWENTISLWRKAVDHNYLPACVELAKYYEHQQRQCDQALEWTERAIGMVDRCISGIVSRREMLKELEHRRSRLLRKLSNQPARANGEDA